MKLLAALLFLPIVSWAQSDVISGQVVNATSNTPLSKVLVSIVPTQVTGVRDENRDLQTRFVITGSDGRFTFLKVPPGKYQLRATRGNDAPQAFMEDGQYGTAIVTGSNVQTTELTFRYRMPAIISGTVTDDTGDPVASAHVFVFLRSIREGHMGTRLAQQRMTDSRGNFHIAHLIAGEYFVAVAARPWYAQNQFRSNQKADQPAPSQDLDVAYPMTYYPGASSISEASAIQLSDGGSATIQMTLHAVPSLHIRVAGVPEPEGEEPKPKAEGLARVGGPGLSAMYVGPNGEPLPGPGAMFNGHELSGIAPGRYLMNTTSQRGGRFMQGGKIVDLASDTVLDAIAPSKISVSGTIAVEGADRPTNRMTVLLRQENGGSAFSRAADKDGAFSFPNQQFAPGRYHISMPNNPAFFLKSVTAKGAKYQDGLLELSDGTSAQLTLLLAPNAQHKVDGIALRDDKPVAGAMVLLLPTAAGQETLVRRDQSDLDGTFSLSGVAPGDYLLCAIDDGHNLAYLDPSVLAPYLPGAQRVTIRSGNLETLKVLVQSRVK